MSETNPLSVRTAAEPGAGHDAGEQAAELTLARIADARLISGHRPELRIMLLVVFAVLTAAGTALRAATVPSWPLVVTACAAVAALAWGGPPLARLAARKEPPWVQAARIHQRSLHDRIPEATAATAQRHAAELTGRRWQSAHLYVCRCTDARLPHDGPCQKAGVFPVNGRLLIVLGEHQATAPAPIAAATLAHEARHVTGWRIYLTRLLGTGSVAGWVILGWAVPWPALLPAAIAFHVLRCLLAQAIEIACDLGGAKIAGPDAMLSSLAFDASVISAARAAVPAWQRRAGTIALWLSGPSHPPLGLRRAIIRARWPLAASPDADTPRPPQNATETTRHNS